MDRITTIDDPFYVGPGGILISSTDILPTELRQLLLPRLRHQAGHKS